MKRRKLKLVPARGTGIPKKVNAVQEFYPLSGKKTLDRILDHPHPVPLVRGLAHGDFYWLVKKIGEGECLPLLQLASREQWQYLLDLELWRKDRMDLEQVNWWLSQLLKADPTRLVKWLFSGGQGLAFYFLFRSIQVVILEEDDDQEIPEGFFTLDGIHYVKVRNPDLKETIGGLLRSMAKEDQTRYQAVLQGLAGVLPAEAEEQMFRMRGVRLAEHGFLPFEEALAVYGPLDDELLAPVEERSDSGNVIDQDDMRKELVPQSPLFHLEGGDIFTKAIALAPDASLQDRIYLEFAGLCNQILSADGEVINDLDVLIKTCRRAAGYLNLTLEKVCRGDLHKALDLVKHHSLITLFRVGFGLALKLKWDLERWIKDAWYAKQGLDTAFWGEVWGQTLKGLLLQKPLFYSNQSEAEPYRDFRSLAEIDDCRTVLHKIQVMDHLFEKLGDRFSLTREQTQSPEMTFYSALFNLWSRNILGLPLSYEGIRLEQVKSFFIRLRSGEKGPPFHMSEREDGFVSDMARLASVSEMERDAELKPVLREIWQAFSEEYRDVSAEDLDQRFSSFIHIKPGPD